MPLITITYSIGNEGEIIGMKVAEQLGLNLYDNAKLQSMALKLGMADQDLAQFDEKAPGFLNRLLSNKPPIYLDIMEKVIHQVAETGEGVIIGHGSPFLLQDFGCAFHIKIQSRTFSRVKRMMEQQRLNSNDAQALVKNMDERQKSFLHYAFKFDIDDPNGYDLVINREKLSAYAAAKIIVDATAIDDLSECSLEAFQAMERLALEKKVRAVLADNHIDLSTLHIMAGDGETVSISGIAYSEADKERLPIILKEMSSIKSYNIKVSVWSQSIVG